jgi:hypothetical protein
MATMPVDPTHSVDQIGAPESTKRVCAVSGRVHLQVHISDLIVVEPARRFVLAARSQRSRR